jgi:hypothetical protein
VSLPVITKACLKQATTLACFWHHAVHLDVCQSCCLRAGLLLQRMCCTIQAC